VKCPLGARYFAIPAAACGAVIVRFHGVYILT